MSRKNRKITFDLSELSEDEKAKITELADRKRALREARELQKKAQTEADTILKEYVKKHQTEFYPLSDTDKEKLKMQEFGTKAWTVLKNAGMRAEDTDPAINYLQSVLRNHGTGNV